MCVGVRVRVRVHGWLRLRVNVKCEYVTCAVHDQMDIYYSFTKEDAVWLIHSRRGRATPESPVCLLRVQNIVRR